MLPVDEQLRQLNHRGSQTIPHLGLKLHVAEEVQFVVLDHVRPQDLLHLLAIVERLSDDAGGRRVYHHLAQLLLDVRLKADAATSIRNHDKVKRDHRHRHRVPSLAATFQFSHSLITRRDSRPRWSKFRPGRQESL